MPYLGETVNTYCVSFSIFCKKMLRMGKVYDILPIKEVIFLSVLNDRIKELFNLSANDLYILTDFDGTITKDSSDSSWASIFKNPNVTDEFVQ